MARVLFNDGVDAALEEYKRLKMNQPEAYDFSENQLNTLGYRLLQLDYTEDAIQILRLNKEEYSQSANTYDSYGDALFANGDTTNSLLNFKEAFAMDSTLTITKEKIMRIEGTIFNSK